MTEAELCSQTFYFIIRGWKKSDMCDVSSKESQDNVVLDVRGIPVRFPPGVEDLPLLQEVHTDSGDHPVSF